MNLQEFNSAILDKKVIVVKDKENTFTQYYYLKRATSSSFTDGNNFHLEYDSPSILRRELKNRITEEGKKAPKSATFVGSQPFLLMCIEFLPISKESLKANYRYNTPITLYEKTPIGSLFATNTNVAIEQILDNSELICEELVYPTQLSVLSLSDIIDEHNSNIKEEIKEIKKYRKIDWKAGDWISYIGSKDWTVSGKYSELVSGKYGEGFFLQSVGKSVVPFRGDAGYDEKCWIPYVEEMHGTYQHHVAGNEDNYAGLDMFDDEEVI